MKPSPLPTRRRALLFALVAASALANLRFASRGLPRGSSSSEGDVPAVVASGTSSDGPAAEAEVGRRPPDDAATTAAAAEDPPHSPPLPRVACFFMVDRDSTETAIAVRYGLWGRRCARFVVVSNGVEGGEVALDHNTYLVDARHVIESELRERNATTSFGTGDRRPSYLSFPSPADETKEHLSLKSFYAWSYVIRNFADSVDYIMKADPDTYVLMDHYLSYLASDHSPDRHAYIGRVFKNDGDSRDPFVTGLSCTLSRITARWFLSASSLRESEARVEGGPRHAECSAERFEKGRKADDHALSRCLSAGGIYPSYTRDERGRERFLHFDPTTHAYKDVEGPAWYRKISFAKHEKRGECCSERACAFHYVEPERMNETLVYDDVFGVWHWEGDFGHVE